MHFWMHAPVNACVIKIQQTNYFLFSSNIRSGLYHKANIIFIFQINKYKKKPLQSQKVNWTHRIQMSMIKKCTPTTAITGYIAIFDGKTCNRFFSEICWICVIGAHPWVRSKIENNTWWFYFSVVVNARKSGIVEQSNKTTMSENKCVCCYVSRAR